MKKLIMIAVLALFYNTAYCEPYDIPAGLLETAAKLYPDAKPPLRLDYKSDMSIGAKGWLVINYDLVSGSASAGTVTRITSQDKGEFPSGMDILVTFADDGTVKQIIPFCQSTDEKQKIEDSGFSSLTDFFTGKKPADYQTAVTIMADGLAAAQGFRNTKSVAPMTSGKTLDLSQQINTPGAPLASLSLTSVYGGVFSTKGYTSPLALIFVNSSCPTCLDMIKAAELADSMSGGDKVRIIYVVTENADTAKALAQSSGIAGRFVVSDPSGLSAKALKVPFKPYALMYDGGSLKMNAYWEDESRFLGMMLSLAGVAD